MGASSSKAAKAAGTASRKFPTTASPLTKASAPRPTPPAPNSTPPPSPATPDQPGPKVYPQPSAHTEKDQTVSLDASDPVFASRLSKLGPVQPNPFMSNSARHPSDPRPNQPSRPSGQRPQEIELPDLQFNAPNPASNPALLILQARQNLQAQAEREAEQSGRQGFAGRKLLDVSLLQQVLRERAAGRPDADIENRYGLAKGIMEKLGARGIVDIV